MVNPMCIMHKLDLYIINCSSLIIQSCFIYSSKNVRGFTKIRFHTISIRQASYNLKLIRRTKVFGRLVLSYNKKLPNRFKIMYRNNKKTQPSKILCVARNYVEHIDELGNEVPSEMALFMKPPSAVANEIHTNKVDAIHYEAEICFNVKAGKLDSVAFGLDLTKRVVQEELKAKGLPWERAKAFDGSAVISQFVCFDGEYNKLSLELFINDKLVQQGGCKLMLYQPEEILTEIQSFCTVEDGDIIMTGTPKGVGEIHQGDQFVGKIFSGQNVLLEKSWLVK